MQKSSRQHAEPPAELENQFILRLPTVPAQSLRHAIREGMSNIKDRMFISMEPDMRRGTVRFDNWYLPAKILDLPTVTESYKSIDGKNFYKTADVSQLMLCKEDDDGSDEESPNKKRSLRVEKKYLYPHGVTPPLKNVRKRRFRRTLRKKFVEVPEIEKEVKRLLRMDNEAVQVRYEEVQEENKKDDSHGAGPSIQAIKEELGEHDIFGEELSDSDEEADRSFNRLEDPDDSESKFSNQDSNMSNTMDTSAGPVQVKTEFDSSMFPHTDDSPAKLSTPSPSSIVIKRELADDFPLVDELPPLEERLEELQRRIADVRQQREAQQQEMAGIDMPALRERFRAMIDDLAAMEDDYRRQYEELRDGMII